MDKTNSAALSTYDGVKVRVIDGALYGPSEQTGFVGPVIDGPILRAFENHKAPISKDSELTVDYDGIYVCRVVECESCAGTGCVECYDPQDATDGQTLRLVREDDSSSDCRACAGLGHKYDCLVGHTAPCPTCNGTGSLAEGTRDQMGCAKCDGTGKDK